MKDRRKRGPLFSKNSFFCCILVLVLFSGFSLSTLRLPLRERFYPRLISAWRPQAIRAISGETPSFSIRETVVFPDQVLVFRNYPSSAPLITKDAIDCVYFSPNSSDPLLKLSPIKIDDESPRRQIVRCPPQPRGFTTSIAVRSNGPLPGGPTHRWNSLAYEALIDRDNTTIVFVKGFNLRPGGISNPSRFHCVYGWDFSKPKLLLRSDVISIGQEIVRCKTPLTILSGSQGGTNPIKVSVRLKGKRTLHSIARPEHRLQPDPPARKENEMCVCTMLMNQAGFMREWVMYHGRIGVQRWFIYDNNSDDNIDEVIKALNDAKFNITRHAWPWIKTQEAGFAHCALRARDSCEWVGFIDVDEFLHLPTTGLSLHDVLANQSEPNKVGELRTSCHSFGPSGLKRAPSEGVMVGYKCRMAGPERHKSIVRPEALNSTLINLVHHFHLRDGFEYRNVDGKVMVINHYKYQVWEAFKEKFYRRVATYVSNWEEEQNVGSKDRTPGLGTRAIEPPDWASRFCEVNDTRLRDRVVEIFTDPQTGMLPWQEQQGEQEARILAEQKWKEGMQE